MGDALRKYVETSPARTSPLPIRIFRGGPLIFHNYTPPWTVHFYFSIPPEPILRIYHRLPQNWVLLIWTYQSWVSIVLTYRYDDQQG